MTDAREVWGVGLSCALEVLLLNSCCISQLAASDSNLDLAESLEVSDQTQLISSKKQSWIKLKTLLLSLRETVKNLSRTEFE